MTSEPSIAQGLRRASSTRERVLAAAVAVLSLIFALLIQPLKPQYSPQFFAAFASAFFLCMLFATVVQMWRTRILGDVLSARLAGAFVYSLPLVSLYTATSQSDLWGSEVSGWSYNAWYIGWTLMLIWHARSPAGRGNTVRIVAVSATASVVVIGLVFAHLLPGLYVGNSSAFTGSQQVFCAIRILLAALAIAAFLSRPSLNSLDTWLAVSLVPLLAASFFGFLSPSRESDDLQIARMMTLLSSIIVVCALLSELARMLQRTSLVERFMMMAESAGTIVYLLDANGAVTYMNRRWTELTGQPVPAALGEGWRKVLHPDDLRRNAPVRAACMATKRPYRVKQRYRQADGEYRWFLSAATAVSDVDGKLAWYGTATDIDAEQRALGEVEALYEREQRISKMLQTAFLPAFLPEIESLALQGVYRASVHEAEVGGDWYDVFTLRDGRLAISIGDIFGHGLEAATTMVRLRETLRAVTAFTDSDPALVLQTTDRVFTASHPETIASALFAIFDPLTRALSMASAGHPPPALLRGGQVSFFPTGGLPLGVDAESTFAVEKIVLEQQDAVAFYTDGLTEVDRDYIQGERRFAELLAEFAEDPERLVDEALRGRQRDDAALLMLFVVDTTARPSWHFKSDDASSAQDARAAFTAHLRRREVDAEMLTVAELVFGELVGNVVRHAPGPIEVELLWRGDVPRIIVRDRGPSFEIGEIALPSDQFLDHGRGFYLISCFATKPVVNPRPGGGNEVVVELAAEVGLPNSKTLVTA